MEQRPYGSVHLTDKEVGQLKIVTECIEEALADGRYLGHSISCPVELTDHLAQAIQTLCRAKGWQAEIVPGSLAVQISLTSLAGPR